MAQTKRTYAVVLVTPGETANLTTETVERKGLTYTDAKIVCDAYNQRPELRGTVKYYVVRTEW